MAKDQEAVTTKAGRTVEVACVKCAVATSHEVLASFDCSGSVGTEPYTTDWNSEHQVIRCRGCNGLSFRAATWTEHDWIPVGDGEYMLDASVKLYPPRSLGRRSLGEHSTLLPPTVFAIYEETVLALSNNQPVLTGIGLRALVEAVCKERKALGDNLFQQVDSLAKQQILTPGATSILHKVRTLGNTAAHEVKPHTSEQLSTALDVVEHLLKEVYILPEIAKRVFTESIPQMPALTLPPLAS